MAIPVPVVSTALTAGATVLTFAKADSGFYTSMIGSDTGTLAMRAVDPLAKKRYLSIALKCNPSLLDAPSAAASGKISINVNCSFSPGSDVTDAYVQARLADIASIISQSAIISALLGGKYE